MDVEKACISITPYLANIYDRSREGYAIDIGVGTFCFYCDAYRKLGFKTIAVEPLPNDNLKELCHKRGIDLIESCIFTTDGSITIYTGEFKGAPLSDLSSVKKDWWGATDNALTVNSMKLTTLIEKKNIKKITFVKVDTEGSEFEILSQLKNLDTSLLPQIVQFEYGGGSMKKDQKNGWSEEFFNNTLKCLKILRNLNYGGGILVDASLSEIKYFEFSKTSAFEQLFGEEYMWGNIILFRKNKININKLCKIINKSQKKKSKFTELLDNIFGKFIIS